MYKQLFKTGVIGTLLAMTVACSEDTKTTTVAPPETPTAAASTDVVKPLTADIPKKEGQIRVSTTGNQPPFSFKDERGNLQGIDIEIIRAIAKEEGLEVVFFTDPWSEVFPSVASGRRDIAVSGVSYSDERNENYTLSSPYLFVPSAIMVMENSGIGSVNDLAGKKFSCMKDAKQCGDIRRLSPTSNIHEVETTFVSFRHLIQGQTDSIGEDLHLLQYFANNHPDQKVKIIAYENEGDAPAQQVMMMAKANNALAQKINNGIAKLKASGEIAKIEQKWVQKP